MPVFLFSGVWLTKVLRVFLLIPCKKANLRTLFKSILGSRTPAWRFQKSNSKPKSSLLVIIIIIIIAPGHHCGIVLMGADLARDKGILYKCCRVCLVPYLSDGMGPVRMHCNPTQPNSCQLIPILIPEMPDDSNPLVRRFFNL